MTKSNPLFALALCLFASLAAAQYTTSAPYGSLNIGATNSCDVTWYGPEIFAMPNGTDLGLLAQGNSPNGCQTVAYDSIFPATRDSGGVWTTPAAFECPRVQGQFIRCGYSYPPNSGPIGGPSIIRLANVNSPNGYRYFMAFVGGNADFFNGKMYWASSDDGTNWTVYGGDPVENWKPLIQSKYERDAAHPRSATPCSGPAGVSEVNLASEGNWIYLFIHYWHPVQPECADGHYTTACETSGYQVYDRAAAAQVLRFNYDANHPWGFGGPSFEVYKDHGWVPNSGRLVWPYDVDANGVQLDSGEAISVYGGVHEAGYQFGGGDLERGNGQWLHSAGWDLVTYIQTANCLDPTACNWSARSTLDLSAYHNNGYSNMRDDITAGLYYGAIRKADGTYTGTHWWIWLPAPTNNTTCGTNVYSGLSLVPAQLCTPDVPCGP
jgi:hypothetical protein